MQCSLWFCIHLRWHSERHPNTSWSSWCDLCHSNRLCRSHHSLWRSLVDYDILCWSTWAICTFQMARAIDEKNRNKWKINAALSNTHWHLEPGNRIFLLSYWNESWILTRSQTEPDVGQLSSWDSITPISCWKLGTGKLAELLRSFRVTRTVVYELTPKKSAVPRIRSISSCVNVGRRDRGNPCCLLCASTRSIMICG